MGNSGVTLLTLSRIIARKPKATTSSLRRPETWHPTHAAAAVAVSINWRKCKSGQGKSETTRGTCVPLS